MTNRLSANVRLVPEYRWPTEINAQMVAVALLKPERMPVYDLFSYIQHLDRNGQSAQIFEIEFWKKLFYPLSCMVMLMLALPFAYLHFRAGGIATFVFGGVLGDDLAGMAVEAASSHRGVEPGDT